MSLPIRTWPDPVLLKECVAWDFNDPKHDYDWLESNMIETLRSEGAIGLAANQVGISYRAMLIHIQKTDQTVMMYNPELLESSSELWTADEGCLSFPNISLSIARPKNILVSYLDRHQNKYTIELEKIDAKCFLHELDHLNGRVFKDYVSNMKFILAQKRAKKR